MRFTPLKRCKSRNFREAWDPCEELVVIRRDMLSDPETFCGVLIHELTHADTGYDDIERSFETALTKWIGHFAWKTISK